MDRFDQQGEAESRPVEPLLYPSGSEAMVWSATTDDASSAPPRPDREASIYMAAWDTASDGMLGRYLDDMRHFDLLSTNEERALCWRIVRLRARTFRALYMSPTTLPALRRLRHRVQQGEIPLNQIVARTEATPSEARRRLAML